LIKSESSRFFSFRAYKSGYWHLALVRWFVVVDWNKRRCSIDRRPWPWSRYGLRQDQMKRYWVSWNWSKR
jgi:hypothetical protein